MRFESVSDVRLSTSPAVEAFLFDFGKVASAYDYDWTRQESYERRAAYLNGGGYRGDRAAVAAALERYNRALGAGEATLESIRLLAQPGTLTVVTGQQPGIFTGPAYSIYKAMTAIHLAREQSQRLGVPVVPVFWVAGEDHDWQEIAAVLTPTGEGMTRVALKESFEGERRSVGLAPAPGSLGEVIDEFLALLPETEFKTAVGERIWASASAGPALPPALMGSKASLADWFARLITWLFAGTGLIVCVSGDPALRSLQAGFFTEAIRKHEQVDEALGRGHERWQSLGFEPTVDRQLGSLNLFTYLDGGERCPLMGAGEQFWVRGREEQGWSMAELLQRAEANPELFSTNVVLRPVVQGRIFPDLAYVGGPGEISYFGLYKDVFAALGQQMPVVYPRESFTLLEPPLARNMEKQGLTLADVLFHLDAKRAEMLEREDRLGITGLFEQFRADFAGLYEGLVGTVLQLDPGLGPVTEENRKQIAVQISKLEEKAKQQHRKNCEVVLRQFDRLKANLAPGGGLQERTVTILPYLAKYGPDLVARLTAEAEFETGTWVHRAVYLGS